uniref:Core shell protein Gag P30 domain-containing protein n=1 Tax=Salvator merianae TaxID=96440 RepID=A0A8D0DJF6_SALMN
MGGGQSTPPELIIKHFPEVYKGKSYTVVRWPPEGTFQQSIIAGVHNVVTVEGNPGYPDDIPYIDGWSFVARNLPPWAKAKVEKQALALLNQEKKSMWKIKVSKTSLMVGIYPVQTCQKEQKKIYPNDAEEPTAPPLPYTPIYPSLPPNPLDRQPHPNTAARAKGPRMKRRRQGPVGGGVRQELLQPMPDSTTNQVLRRRPITINQTQMYPIRQVVNMVTQPPDAGGVAQPPQAIPVDNYVPFQTSDLMNWKIHSPSYSEDPERAIEMIRGLVATHCPTWADLEQLSFYLLTAEERRQNMEDAIRANVGHGQDPDQRIRELAPCTEPNWDFRTDAGRTALEEYRTRWLAALQKGKKRVINVSKIGDVVQKKDETPGDFLERLLTAYRRWTPFDPEQANNQQMVAMSFVSQSASDIKRELQKLEEFEGMEGRNTWDKSTQE